MNVRWGLFFEGARTVFGEAKLEGWPDTEAFFYSKHAVDPLSFYSHLIIGKDGKEHKQNKEMFTRPSSELAPTARAPSASVWARRLG